MVDTFKLLKAKGNEDQAFISTNTGKINVVNLSNVQLTKPEIEILDLGLQFVPTFCNSIFPSTQAALDRFSRQIKFKYFFHGHERTKAGAKFTEKSTWTPPCNNASISTKLEELENLVTFKVKPRDDFVGNLSKVELQTIKTLKNNPDIIIKPADKGSATVFMSRDCYIREAKRQLNNTKHYAPLQEPAYPLAAQAISLLLNKIEISGYISAKQNVYLQPPMEPRVRQLYLLPKIHKAADKWPQPDRMPPGRPIISDCGSESYRVGEYIDSFLAPLAVCHSSYVKNTTDFQNKVTQIVSPGGAMLFTMDVESLYTNVTCALQARFKLNKDPTSAIRKCNLSSLLQKIICVRNNMCPLI